MTYCIQQSPSRCVSLSANGVEKCDGWNPNSCRSLVLSQSQDEMSAGPNNLSGLEVTACDFVYCSLSFLRFVSVPTYEGLFKVPHKIQRRGRQRERQKNN